MTEFETYFSNLITQYEKDIGLLWDTNIYYPIILEAQENESMTCNISACNAKIQARIDKLRVTDAFPRADIYRDLIYRGGSLYYIAAPRLIPEDVKEVRTAYGVMPVLHLEMRVCQREQGPAEFTDNVDWSGVSKGEYVTDKGFLKVEVHEDITEYDALRPLSRVINAGKVTIRYLGTAEADWVYVNGRVMRRQDVLGGTVAATDLRNADDEVKDLKDRVANLEKMILELLEAEE